MEIVFRSLLVLHIVTGFASLVLFWIPMFTRKGGKTHRKVGIWYVRCMWGVVITAAILSIKNLVIGQTTMGAFLGFISLITANPLWYGIAILKYKKSRPRSFRLTHLGFRLSIVLSGIALITYGILLQGKGAAILMFLFGGLGLTDAPSIIRSLRNREPEPDWFRQHLVGMCTTGIAAYTAFFVFGANQFLAMVLSGYWSIIPWVAPTVIGTIGIRRSVAKYQKAGMIKS